MFSRGGERYPVKQVKGLSEAQGAAGRKRPRTTHLLAALVGVSLLFCPPAFAGSLLGDIQTDLAMYAPGATVNVYALLTNRTGINFSGSVAVGCFHLGRQIGTLPSQIIHGLAPGAATTLVFSWIAPASDYQGYRVSIAAMDDAGRLVDTAASAIDVSSDWTRFPRYGYVAHYDSGLDAYGIMSQLKNYHLNGIQFYDWQWKHHVPYNPNPTWSDIANRTIYRSTVTNLLAAAHAFNMVAMNYNLYGGAFDSYQTDGSGVQLAMGIFAGAPPTGGYTLANQMNVGLPAGWATTKLYEMNNRDSAWQNYIFMREQAVFNNFGFDGWHIDSLGTHSAYDFNGVSFSLDDNNPAFINNAKATLGKRMTFNAVDAGGESQVAQSANVDFVYSELWSGNANYGDLNSRVDNVRKFGSKSLVLAAYLDRGLNSGYFNEPGVRLADAAMFACGASHLELGDGDKMLHVEYFPNDTTVLMAPSLRAAMRAYYDFLVAYENLLRDDTVSGGQQVIVTGAPTSTNGAPGAVWVISKKKLGFNVTHLVNLANNSGTLWRDNVGNYPAPPSYTNLAVKMYYTGTIGNGGLWYATPDANYGGAAPLAYGSGSDAGGAYVTFTLPSLQYWDMIWLELKGSTSAAAKIIGSNYDSMAAIGLEGTTDTGGGYDVCCVNNTGGGSYIAFNNLDFGSGATTLSARVASALPNGTLEFRLDNPAGPLIATIPVGDTGGWQSWRTVNAPVLGASGVHAVFAVFKSAPSNLNWFQFALGSANRSPVLAPISDQTVVAGTQIAMTNSAWDPDVPPQTLTYSLVSGPAGAAVDPGTGLFTWRPLVAASPFMQNVCVAVADNGTPSLTATRCFTITVLRPVQPLLSSVAMTNSQFVFQVSGDYGPDYSILASSNLVNWTIAFTSNAPGLPFMWFDSNPSFTSTRFYRVVLGP